MGYETHRLLLIEDEASPAVGQMVEAAVKLAETILGGGGLVQAERILTDTPGLTERIISEMDNHLACQDACPDGSQLVLVAGDRRAALLVNEILFCTGRYDPDDLTGFRLIIPHKDDGHPSLYRF